MQICSSFQEDVSSEAAGKVSRKMSRDTDSDVRVLTYRTLQNTSGTRQEHVRNTSGTRQEHVRNTSGTRQETRQDFSSCLKSMYLMEPLTKRGWRFAWLTAVSAYHHHHHHQSTPPPPPPPLPTVMSELLWGEGWGNFPACLCAAGPGVNRCSALPLSTSVCELPAEWCFTTDIIYMLMWLLNWRGGAGGWEGGEGGRARAAIMCKIDLWGLNIWWTWGGGGGSFWRQKWTSSFLWTKSERRILFSLWLYRFFTIKLLIDMTYTGHQDTRGRSGGFTSLLGGRHVVVEVKVGVCDRFKF